MIEYDTSGIGKEIIDWIYISLIAMICVNPLLNMFVSDTAVLRAIELVFFVIAIVSLLLLKRRGELVSYSGFSKFLVICLVATLLGIIYRGTFHWGDNKQVILHIIGTSMPCLLPLILLFLPNRYHQDWILRIFFYGSLIYLPIVFLNIDTGLVLVESDMPWAGEGIGAWLPFFAAFLLGLMNDRFGKIEKILIITVWTTYFILMLLNARRNVSFTLLVYMVLAYFYYSFKQGSYSTRFIAIVFALMVGVFMMLNFEQFAKGPFSVIYQRANKNTRSGVEMLMLADFVKSPKEDWIFGRGLDGGYYQRMENVKTGEVTTNRQVIETGYLNMVLKGGILFNIVVVLLIICAIRKAFRRNDNDSYFFGLILITYLIDNYTTNPIYIFGPRSIIFWFMISCILANRNEDEVDIEDYDEEEIEKLELMD